LEGWLHAESIIELHLIVSETLDDTQAAKLTRSCEYMEIARVKAGDSGSFACIYFCCVKICIIGHLWLKDITPAKMINL
jgi:hypothetical protein